MGRVVPAKCKQQLCRPAAARTKLQIQLRARCCSCWRWRPVGRTRAPTERSCPPSRALAAVLARGALVTGALSRLCLPLSGSRTSSCALRRWRTSPSSVGPGAVGRCSSRPRWRRPCSARARTRGRSSVSRNRKAPMPGLRTSCCRRRAWASSGCSRSVCCPSGSGARPWRSTRVSRQATPRAAMAPCGCCCS